MKQTTLTQRLLSALVALCMVLSVCAPALAAEPGRASAAVIYYQKDGGKKTLLDALSIKTLMPGYKITFVRNLIIITMGSTEHTGELEGVTLSGNGSDPYNFELCTAGTSWVTDISDPNNPGLTITGMKNVTVTPARGSSIGFLGSLKIVDCTGDVNLQNSSEGAVDGRLEVDNSAGHGSVTITENCDRTSFGRYLPYGTTITSNGPVKIENKNGCAVCGSLEIKESASVDITGTATNGQAAITGIATISSNGPVKIENQLSKDLKGGAAVGYLNEPNITGTIFEVKKSASVEVISVGANPTLGGWAFIKSSGDVSITNSLGGSAVGRGLTVTTDGAVTVKGDNAAAIKGKATITAGRNVSIQNESGIAVEGKLIVNSSTGVTVVGNTQKNAVRYEANITSSGAVNISNSQGIAVGGKLTVKNASGTGDVTVSGKGGNTVGGGAEITSRGAVNITNTDNTGLAVSGDLTVYDSKRVKVSGGTANSPAVSGKITLTSSGEMELSNPNGQVTSNKLTVKNSTGNVIVTGNKSGSTALVQGGASINTTGAVTITNSSGPAIFSGLNVEQSGGITVTGSRASEPIITGNSTIKNTNKVEIINNETSGRTALNITYTPPDGKGYFYQTERNGRKLHTRSAISGTTPYLCIEPDTLYTLTLPEGVTAKTNGTSDTRFYADEMVTVTAPADTETTKFEKWTLSGTEPTDLPNGWETSKEFTFKMPASNVTLGASYHTITKYEVKVTGGTIGGKTGMTTGSFQPGDEVTVVFDDSGDIAKQFKQWTYTGTAPAEPDGGWTAANNSTSKTFTFKMPAGNVNLTAAYKDVYTLTVDDGKGTILVNGVAGSRALEGDQITVTETGSDEHHLFSSWELTSSTPLGEPSDNWQTSKAFTFTMPAGNVNLTAAYKDVYTLTVDDGKGTILVNGVAGNRALAGDQITVTEKGSDKYHLFSSWQLTSSTSLVHPSENWQTSKEFTFTMPAGNVTLKADYKQLYDLTVTGGTIVGGNGDTGIYLPGTEVTVVFDDSHDIAKQFKQWKSTDTEPEAPDGGWTAANDSTSKTFTFKMPAGNVTLTAAYKDVYTLTVADGKGTILVNGVAGNRALAGDQITVTETGSDEHHLFSSWELTSSTPLGEPSENWQTSRTFTFTMPAGNVSLKADYKQLYDLTVNGGTIVDGSGDTGKTTGIYLPGTEVTIQFTESDEITEQFEKWTGGDNITNADQNWQNSKRFTFTMPDSAVTLTAVHQKTYFLSEDMSKAEFFVNGKQVNQAPAGARVTVKLVDGFINDHREFDQWQPAGGTALVDPEEGWQNKPSFSFTMPDGMVILKAYATFLFDVTVNGGTIVGGNGDTGTSQKIVKPGQLVTVAFTESTDIEKQFEQWTLSGTEPTDLPNDWQSKPSFSFTMPAGNVTLTAVHQKTYFLSEDMSKAEFFVNGKQVNQAPAGARVTVKLVDGFINDHREFDQWQPAGGTALVDPEEGWQNKPSFSFTMPDGMVILKAYATFLFDVTVNGGTIVGGNGDTGTSQKIVKPGQLVTVRAESTEENPFLQWNSTSEPPAAPDGGWPEGGWQTSQEFTFKMPYGDVTLEAQRDQLYKVSINDRLGSVTINGEPRSSLWVKEGETVTVATTLKDGYWMEFEKWNSTGTAPEEPEGGWTETNKSTSTTFTFKMPNGPVELVAQWSASSLDPDQPIDPDEPLDEDFGVEPTPMDTTGGTIAAVAVGGAAIWGGYEIATRVILHSLLPEGTAIPANRGQLALLVWNAAGRPEPAGAPAFADVADPDMAKAAQWCTEQGIMAAKGDRFEPEGWTPKFKVIEVWNKAFPAA